jgi:hypothetical protein
MHHEKVKDRFRKMAKNNNQSDEFSTQLEELLDI